MILTANGSSLEYAQEHTVRTCILYVWCTGKSNMPNYFFLFTLSNICGKKYSINKYIENAEEPMKEFTVNH